jgi:L-ascorbate metabolism protein UlaG (beta-lactamase superfamily)
VAIRLTWWGHATVLIEDRARIMTDPLLTGTLMHLHRRAGQNPSSMTLQPDAVVLSHLHADHLHLRSLSLLEAGMPVLIPRGAAYLLRRLKVEPIEVVAGDSVAIGGARVTVVPAIHDATRWPGGRIRGDAVGYLVEGEGATYFAGDTVAFPEMADLHPRLDVALMPVGGWGPWLRGHHLNPTTAADCLPVIGPRVSVPIHYGTFWPRGMGWLRSHVFHEPGRDFAAHAHAVAPDVDVRLLAPGSSTQVDVLPA